jgi:hypothetical protein
MADIVMAVATSWGARAEVPTKGSSADAQWPAGTVPAV